LANSKARADMTTGTPWKQILIFSLPIMAGNLLQQLYNTVDGIVVGNFVSEDALAATGAGAAMAFFFLALSMGLGNGVGIMISQLYGAKRYDELKSAVSTSLIMLIGFGLIVSVVAAVLSPALFTGLMQVEEGPVRDMSITYFAIYSIGFVLQFAYNTVASILRAVGDSKATLWFLMVSAVMNLILDLVFVIAFRWGVAGAAIATVISQLASAVVSFIYMFKKYEMFRFGRGEFVFAMDKCKLCLRLGIPNTIQSCIVSFGNIMIQRLVNSFGAVNMAAFTVGTRVENYMFVPVNGYTAGISTFVAQNVGAKNFDRAKKGWRQTAIMTVATSLIIGSLLYIFAEPAARLFGVSDEALARSVSFVRYLCFLFWIFTLYMSLIGVLQGSGDVLIASGCSLAVLGTRVALAYIFVYVFDIGYASCWLTMPIGWAVGFVVAVTRYISGRWKTKGIVKD